MRERETFRRVLPIDYVMGSDESKRSVEMVLGCSTLCILFVGWRQMISLEETSFTDPLKGISCSLLFWLFLRCRREGVESGKVALYCFSRHYGVLPFPISREF
jgi:hypothetical protein